MKLYVICLIQGLLLTSLSFGQAYVRIDHAKIQKKKYSTDQVENFWVFRNLITNPPKNMRFIDFGSTPDEIYLNWLKRLEFPKNNISIERHKVIPGDTASLIYNGEIINRDEIFEFAGLIPVSVIKEQYVSNDEWKSFQNYVADSIKRKLLFELGSNEFENSFIPTFDEKGDVLERSEWRINWKFSIEKQLAKNPGLYYHIEDLYIHRAEQHDRLIQLDARKVVYEYLKPVGKMGLEALVQSHIYPDSLNWINVSNNHYGSINEQLATFYHSHSQFEQEPACNLVESQVLAYLNWKETMHQNWLDQKNINLVVNYRLPYWNEADLIQPTKNSITIPEYNLDWWRITNKDYLEFVEYVRDSIAHRILGEEIDENLYLKRTKYFNGEELDPSRWNINWKKEIKWDQLSELEQEYLSGMFIPEHEYTGPPRIDERKLVYTFYPLELSHAAKARENQELVSVHEVFSYDDIKVDSVIRYAGGKHESVRMREWDYAEYFYTIDCYHNNSIESVILIEDKSSCIHSYHEFIYPTLDVEWMKDLEQMDEEGMLSENYVPQFDYTKTANVYDFESNPDASVQINYSQAVAFYYWKRKTKGQIVNHPNILLANYIPSKEEWLQIQEGKEMIRNETSINTPSPKFRYVISFYPRDKVEDVKITFVKYVMGGDQMLFKKGKKYAIYSFDSMPICEFIYDNITYDYDDDLYLVEKEGLFGKMDYSGKILIPVQYEEIKFESYNKYMVKRNGEWENFEINR